MSREEDGAEKKRRTTLKGERNKKPWVKKKNEIAKRYDSHTKTTFFSRRKELIFFDTQLLLIDPDSFLYSLIPFGRRRR